MRIMSSTTILLACTVAALHAQAPGTDIYIASLSGAGTSLQVGPAHNVTARAGYDNQPSFTPTSGGTGLLYTATSAEGQTEIWYLASQANRALQLTHTAESEYSPTVTPDEQSFSVIRVEVDSTQRLWRFAMDGSSPTLVLHDVQPVGYHAWGDATTLALFVLGNPPTLQIADARSGEARVVAENIGRSLHKVPGRHAISFLHRPSDDEAWITIYDLDSGTMERVAPSAGRNEFYAWTPDGTLITGEGSELLRWSDGDWQVFADLSGDGVAEISRIAVSPDGTRIAVVGADLTP